MQAKTDIDGQMDECLGRQLVSEECSLSTGAASTCRGCGASMALPVVVVLWLSALAGLIELVDGYVGTQLKNYTTWGPIAIKMVQFAVLAWVVFDPFLRGAKGPGGLSRASSLPLISTSDRQPVLLSQALVECGFGGRNGAGD